MSTKDKIQEMHQMISEMYDKKYVFKSRKYDEIVKHLSYIKFDDVKIASTVDDYGEDKKILTYSITTEILYDEEGNIRDNPVFEAINILNMLNYDDIKKLRKKLYKK